MLLKCQQFFSNNMNENGGDKLTKLLEYSLIFLNKDPKILLL